MTNDLVSDMLTRIRNASLARHSFTRIRYSKLNLAILKVLEAEGYIKEFYIGGNEYTLTYVSNPKQDYDRISKWDDWNDGMSLLLTNNKKIKLTKASYTKLMNDYGKLIGIKPLHMKIIHKRF